MVLFAKVVHSTLALLPFFVFIEKRLGQYCAKVEFFGIFIFNNVKSDFEIILYQPNKVVFKVKVLHLQCLYSYRKPRWEEVGQTYIHIRRNCTLWF